MLTGVLVFFMNAGFAMLETGFCRAKNSITVLAKNLIVFAITTIAFWLVGYGIMFGKGDPFFGENGFLLFQWQGFLNPITSLTGTPVDLSTIYQIFPVSNLNPEKNPNLLPLSAHFFFQLTFAATAATIISGAVAERIRFGVFCAFSFFFIIVYALIGHWVWSSDGWLYSFGFRDFAGSSVVHSVGGWAGLMGTLLLQPRLKKYQKIPPDVQLDLKEISINRKRIISLPGDNLPLATLGCFILWLGWFGFNGGSTLVANPGAITHAVMTTFMAGAVGAISATFWAWWRYGQPSLGYIINGILAGCVSITASSSYVSLLSTFLIALVGGILVVEFTLLLDKWEIDDPVGAIPVHLICGIWGTLAVGFFSEPGIYENWSELFPTPPHPGLLFGGGVTQLGYQLIGIILIGVVTLLSSYVIYFVISQFSFSVCYSPPKIFNIKDGLRVSAEEEMKGIDKLFVESKEQEYRLDGDLTKHLENSLPQQKQEAAKIACQFVVEKIGLKHPAIQEGLDILKEGSFSNLWLIRELDFFLEQQENKAWELQENIDPTYPRDLENYYQAFRRISATKAVYFALKTEPIQAIAEAFAALEEEDCRQLKREILIR
jgi:Amt family ammonium transporter